jgi:hypothetical protein
MKMDDYTYITLRNDLMKLLSIVRGDYDGNIWETQAGNDVKKWRRKGYAINQIILNLSDQLHADIDATID